MSNEYREILIQNHLSKIVLALLVLGVLVACNFSAGTEIEPTSLPTATHMAEPATSTKLAKDTPAYVTFAINVHDIVHVSESGDTLLRLIDLFAKYGVRGDFYLTAPMTHLYAEQRPDVIERLRESDMTISYHVRPPDPLYAGFDQRLQGLDEATLAATILDYQTYRLDMATGDLLRNEPGGYKYVAGVFDRNPVVVSVPNARWRDAALPIFADLGARAAMIYHETGTDPDRPFEYQAGLLVRPSDFSVTRWPNPQSPDPTAEQFWWNMLNTPLAGEYNPSAYLQTRLHEWDEDRPPFVTVLIHENNYYRCAQTPFANIYWADGDKSRPLDPPYDLDAPDGSQPRPLENQEAIWAAYEELVAYAAANLSVVTSEDLVALASDGK